MIERELERNISNFVYRQFLLSGSENFLDFYSKYKGAFRIKNRKILLSCGNCEKIVIGNGIGFEVETGEGEKIKHIIHETCLDEIVYSRW